MNKEHTRIDLVEGGNVFRQGDHATLGFIPRDYAGNIVDLTGKLIDVSILGRKGIMFTSTATFDSAAQVIRVLIDEVLDYGDHRIEFTVTDPNDADYRRKFPSGEYDGRIKITPGADNMDFVGVAMTTVTQLRNEQEAAQVSYEQTVDGKITGIESTVAELESTVETGIAAFTQDSEVVKARGGEVNLGARLDKTDQELAEMASKTELANVLDGSPKGTYATLADLQAAFPTGTTGVYIVTADGHIYSWSGTAWVSRGLYQAIGIADGSVASKNLSTPLQDSLTFPIANKLANGDFPNVTGWAGLYATLSALNNTMTVTGDGASPNFNAWVTTDVDTIVGKKVFIKFKVKTLNNQATKIEVRLKGTTGGTLTAVHTVTSPIQDDVYDVYFSTTLTDLLGTGKLRVYITQYYTLTTVANGAQMEISKMSVLDYSANGLSAYGMTDAEFANILNQNLTDGYFSGTVDLFNSKKVLKTLANLPEPTDTSTPAVPAELATFAYGEKKIIAVKRERVYRSGFGGTDLSIDGGTTWTPVTGITQTVVVGVILINDVALLFSDDTLFRSTDGMNFTGTLFSTIGFAKRPYYTGVWGGDGRYVPAERVVFAEYNTANDGAPVGIWRSHDSGATWTRTLNVTADVRHFHLVRWNPQTYKWYACTGDTNSEIRWYEGDTTATNWTAVVEGDAYSNPQIYRVLGMLFDEGNNFYWITDSDLAETSSVMKANYSNLLDPEILVTLPNVGYGLVGEGSIMFAVSRPNYMSPSAMTYLYGTFDSGKTWNIIKKDLASTTIDGGYYEIHGPNHRGEFLVNHRETAGLPAGHFIVSY